MRRIFPAMLAALVLFVAPAPPGSAETDDANHPAARTIIEFNKAVTARDMDTAMSLLAEGGVQFHLHPAHPGMSEDHPLTEDMPTMWTVVSAILFPTTDAYERKIKIADVYSDGELAVVWTETTTITHRKDIDEPMVLNFSEMYFLVNKDNTGWLIAGTATNRPVDSIPVG
jgi:hypothetical protein